MHDISTIRRVTPEVLYLIHTTSEPVNLQHCACRDRTQWPGPVLPVSTMASRSATAPPSVTAGEVLLSRTDSSTISRILLLGHNDFSCIPHSTEAVTDDAKCCLNHRDDLVRHESVDDPRCCVLDGVLSPAPSDDSTNTRSSKLSLAAILDTSINRLHALPTSIMTVHLQPPTEFAVTQGRCAGRSGTGSQ